MSASPLLLLRALWQQAKLSVTEVVECYGNKAVMVKNLMTLSGVVLGAEGSADPKHQSKSLLVWVQSGYLGGGVASNDPNHSDTRYL